MDLREIDLPVETDIMERKLQKGLDYANKKGIRYVIIAGETEYKQEGVLVKDMRNSTQKLLNRIDLVKYFERRKRYLV